MLAATAAGARGWPGPWSVHLIGTHPGAAAASPATGALTGLSALTALFLGVLLAG